MPLVATSPRVRSRSNREVHDLGKAPALLSQLFIGFALSDHRGRARVNVFRLFESTSITSIARDVRQRRNFQL